MYDGELAVISRIQVFYDLVNANSFSDGDNSRKYLNVQT